MAWKFSYVHPLFFSIASSYRGSIVENLGLSVSSDDRSKKVSGEGTIADQMPTNRGDKLRKGFVLSNVILYRK